MLGNNFFLKCHRKIESSLVGCPKNHNMKGAIFWETNLENDSLTTQGKPHPLACVCLIHTLRQQWSIVQMSYCIFRGTQSRLPWRRTWPSKIGKRLAIEHPDPSPRLEYPSPKAGLRLDSEVHQTRVSLTIVESKHFPKVFMLLIFLCLRIIVQHSD